MFSRLALIASLEARAIKIGREVRICAFAAMHTTVSVIPFAIFASVFPVQGAIISASSGRLGPSGSASAIVRIGGLPVISDTLLIRSAHFPNRVSVVADIS